MGAERKFKTPKAMERKIRAYFRSISRLEPVLELVPDYELDEEGQPLADENGRVEVPLDQFGHVRRVLRVVRAADGTPATEEKWIVPPSVAGIQDALGISRQCWSEYSQREGYREVIQWARGRVEAYNAACLMDPKRARGAEFNLRTNFGWTAKTELSLDEPTRAAVAASGPQTMEEKLELLQKMGLKLPGMTEEEEKRESKETF